jgi:hypothetical protein
MTRQPTDVIVLHKGLRQGAGNMRRYPSVAIAVAVSVLLSSAASAAPVHAKQQHGRIWHGYGFLPGYRSPEQVEWDRMHRPTNWYGAPAYWYGYPGFYRGRWNGGGFGPCWTPTPIGPHWDCG